MHFLSSCFHLGNSYSLSRDTKGGFFSSRLPSGGSKTCHLIFVLQVECSTTSAKNGKQKMSMSKLMQIRLPSDELKQIRLPRNGSKPCHLASMPQVECPTNGRGKEMQKMSKLKQITLFAIVTISISTILSVLSEVSRLCMSDIYYAFIGLFNLPRSIVGIISQIATVSFFVAIYKKQR